MSSSVTVITPTIPGRERLLAECVASVYAQTIPVEAHLVRASVPNGPPLTHLAGQLNRLLAAVTTEWTVTLADDDLLLPNFVQALPNGAIGDVFYSWDASGTAPRVDCTDWPQPKLVDHLRRGNFIAATACIRTSVLRDVGGWSRDPKLPEDWELWRLLAAAGARFRCTPLETWVYRTDGDWPRISTS